MKADGYVQARGASLARVWRTGGIAVCLLVLSANANAALQLAASQPAGRTAFYRGEVTPFEVDLTNTAEADLPNVTLSVLADETLLFRQPAGALGGHESRKLLLRIDTQIFRSGEYQLHFVASNGNEPVATTVQGITIARRPNPDRMEVWMWPHQSFIDQMATFNEESKKTLDWWAELGLNNFSFSLGAKHGDEVRKFWDHALAKGLNVTLQPEGGLTGVPLGDDPDAPFRGPNGEVIKDQLDSTKLLANPFHPANVKWHDEQNRGHMEVAADYPQINTAFFNTEMLDNVKRNGNAYGQRLMQSRLGFTEESVGPPQYIRPGVLASVDRGYQLDRFVFQHGNGLVLANERTADMVHRFRPDIRTLTDPYRARSILEGFRGVDVISTWTYVNPDPKLMLAVESLRAACRDGNKTPMSTVTMLNYPGELAPTDRWMMLDEGRLSVATWINLSRAPRILSYYFSSNCDPFRALGGADLSKLETVNDFEVPRATFARLKELSTKVIQPYGPLLKKLSLVPRRVAVLDSTAARLYGKSPALRGYYPNMQVYHFYTLLAMAQLPADVVFDETVERWGLDDYDMLVLPKCDVLEEKVFNQVVAFQRRGGIVIADQYLGAELPGVIRFDFDFTYRDKVSASAIVKNQSYAQWNDRLKPNSAEMKSVQGVTAMDDQRIMESYAAQLRRKLDEVPVLRSLRRIDCDSPTALTSELELDGVRYIVVVNDKREYGNRLGEFKSILEKVVPQSVTIRISNAAGKFCAYDLLKGTILDSSEEGNDALLRVKLDEAGGTIIALAPHRFEGVLIRPPGKLCEGESSAIQVEIHDSAGQCVPGGQPLKVTLTDPAGREDDLSGFYCAVSGAVRIPFTPAINDVAGRWKVTARDLTSGMTGEAAFVVEAGRVQVTP